MNDINYRVSLDMFDVQSQTTIKAKKGDTACKINITLTKHGKMYKIGEGCEATLFAKKSDGNYVDGICEIVGDTIVYDFKSSIDDKGIYQITTCEGNVECEVRLYKDGVQLTSPRFTLAVDGTVYNGEKIASTPQSDTLRELIDEANDTVNEIETKLENGEFNGKDGKDAVTDQTYSATSENAQSGKAVGEALQGYVEKAEGNGNTEQVYVVDAIGNQKMLEVEDSGYFETGLSYGNIPRRKSSGNIMTNTPVDDLDCANKKYVDDATANNDWAVHFLAHTSFKVKSLNIFRKPKVELYFDKLTSVYEMFKVNEAQNRNNTVEHLVININEFPTVNATGMFSCLYEARDMVLKRLTLNFSFANCTKFYQTFACLSGLEVIDGMPLDFSGANATDSTTGTFNYCNALKEVRFVQGTMKYNIQFSNCPSLSDESIQSIIDGLADLNGGESKTIRFHSTVHKKLTDAQKATIANKNWVLTT